MSKRPNKRWLRTKIQPTTTNQMTLSRVCQDETSRSSTTSLPNGRAIAIPTEICFKPMGIPIMVKQVATPAVTIPKAAVKPPKISQMMFPKRLPTSLIMRVGRLSVNFVKRSRLTIPGAVVLGWCLAAGVFHPAVNQRHMNCIKDVDGRLTWLACSPMPLESDTLRIKVAATAVNRADLVQREGRYPPPTGVTEILGLECAGTVVEVGSRTTRFAPGDQVVALLSGGGYSEEVVVPEGQVMPLPAGLSLLEGAAVPEVFATAWLNLRLEGGLAKGERVLVHAAGSGVGTTALQLCRAWGNPVVGTARSEEKFGRLMELGAELAVNTSEPGWMKRCAANGKFDVVLDPIGGRFLESNVFLLNPLGRLVNIGLMGGSEGTLPLGPVLTKRLTLKGSVLRSRTTEEKSRICEGLQSDVWPLLESGWVKPVIDSVMDITEAEAAHQKVASNKTVGKVVLRVP